MLTLEPHSSRHWCNSKMSDFFHIQTSDSVEQKVDGLNSFTNPSTTHHLQHHQISQTIFLCVNKHHTPSHNDMNIEVIDISDDDEDNTSRNGTSIVCLDDNEIEVIELSDDDEDEVNDELSGEIVSESGSTLDNHEINEFSMNKPLDLTYKTILQQQKLTDFDPIAPSTEQSEEEDNTNGGVSGNRVLITIGLSCPECPLLLENRSKLVQHLLEKQFPFKCQIHGCNGQFENRFWLNEHYWNHSMNQNTKWACSAVDCTFEALHQKSFLHHMHQRHEKGIFQCAICLVQYPYRYMVYNHYTTAHKHNRNMVHKIFSCPVDSCHFVGSTNGVLKDHQLTHTQLKSFRCTWPDCDYAMNHRGNVIQHIRVNHLHIPRTKKKAAQRNIQSIQNPHQFVAEMQF